MEKIKKTVCEILDMNGGEFLYSPSVFLYINGDPIISCHVTDTMTGESHTVMDKNIINGIHDMTAKMTANRASYKKSRRLALEKELACLK